MKRMITNSETMHGKCTKHLCLLGWLYIERHLTRWFCTVDEASVGWAWLAAPADGLDLRAELTIVADPPSSEQLSLTTGGEVELDMA